MYRKLKTVLYHGTVSEIQKIDVKLGHERKDFGRGFYMAVSKNQAIGMMHDFDMVIGPTADDDTALCLKSYWDGLYGRTGTATAKKILLNNLEVENLGVQYFVGKQDVADRLIVSIKEIGWEK